MNLKKIIETCKVRTTLELGCKNCMYNGKTCKHTCDILKVDKPIEYNTINQELLNKEEK